jgi:hypothetical protein
MPKMIAALTLVGLISACTGKLGGPPPAPVFGGTYSDSVGFTASATSLSERALPVFGRNAPRRGDNGGDLFRPVLQAAPFCAGRLVGQADTRSPRLSGPDRAWHKTARTVRADIAQHGLDAICAEGAFIAADTRLCRIRGQVAVAHLAIGSDFKQGSLQRKRANPLQDWPMSHQRCMAYSRLPNNCSSIMNMLMKSR